MAVAATLLVVVAVVDLAGPAAGWDRIASGWLQGPESYPLTVAGFLTDWLFSAQVVLGLATLVCAGLALRRNWVGVLSVAAVFPLVLVEAALKYLIAQPPASTYLQVRLLFRTSFINLEPLAHGFPSGHAARLGFVLGWVALVVVPVRRRKMGLAVAAACGLFAAWSRIYVGDHSLLEIVAGLLLAVIFLVPAAVLGERAIRRR